MESNGGGVKRHRPSVKANDESDQANGVSTDRQTEDDENDVRIVCVNLGPRNKSGHRLINQNT